MFRLTPFSSKASLHRSTNKARQALPKSPRKKTKVIQCLIHNLSPSSRGNLSKMMRWQPEPSSKGCHPSLSDKKKEFLLAFLKSEGMSYTMPGRKDYQVYVGKDKNGKRMYKAKHYLLWTLREIFSMLNQELCSENSFKTKFNETLTFSTLYRFVKENKEIYYQHKFLSYHSYVKNVRTLNFSVKGLKDLKQVSSYFQHQCVHCYPSFAAITAMKHVPLKHAETVLSLTCHH